MVRQQTIIRSEGFTGIALHHGGQVNVRLLPAAEDSGIVFRRVDLSLECRADCRHVGDTYLATTLKKGNAEIAVVEHLLAALAAVGIDNLIVELDGDEMPILDGSAAPWCWLLTACGIHPQAVLRRYIRVKKEVVIEQDNRRVSWQPAVNGDCRYEVNIAYPHKPVDRSGRYFSFCLERNAFEREISKARTFCYVNDVEQMHRRHRALGGSLQNAVVYDDHAVINAEGLRYKDEFVRHKLLDAIGDCYINGYPILGEYHGDKPGHDLNNRLMCALMEDTDAWEWSNS